MNTNVKELIDYSKKGIVSKTIEKTDKADTTLFCMAAGTELDEHTSTKQGVVYVIEGLGEFIIEGKKIKMEPGCIIFMNANFVHSLKSEENTSFLLILTK